MKNNKAEVCWDKVRQDRTGRDWGGRCQGARSFKRQDVKAAARLRYPFNKSSLIQESKSAFSKNFQKSTFLLRNERLNKVFLQICEKLYSKYNPITDLPSSLIISTLGSQVSTSS